MARSNFQGMVTMLEVGLIDAAKYPIGYEFNDYRTGNLVEYRKGNGRHHKVKI